jgi:hypothetical protein
VITGGFKDKLVLLHGYKVPETGIDRLELPSMTIPNLFLQHKLLRLPHSSLPKQGLDSSPPAAKSAINAVQPIGRLDYASVASLLKVDPGNIHDELSIHRASPKYRLIDPNIVESTYPSSDIYAD